MAASPLERALDTALGEVPARRHIQSLIVARGGQIQIERYFRDRGPGDLTNIHSVTKSVLATLTGIAIGDGYIALDTTLSDVLSDHPFDDDRKRAITVEHLLTMTSGLDAATPHDIDEIADRGESWVDGPLAAPLTSEPGATFEYNNGAAHALGVVLSRAIEMPLRRFAETRLFEPLAIETYRWPEDPGGNPLGYGHLELRPRDLVQLGHLYLDSGRHGQVELVPSWYVDAAVAPHNDGGPPEGVSYGYLWWVTQDAGYRAFFAGGFGGQYVTVVPDLELVVVTTGDVDVFIDTSRNLRRLVAEVVIPELTT
jgi:CubicO group peptidase (beta-lactamase class C family)